MKEKILSANEAGALVESPEGSPIGSRRIRQLVNDTDQNGFVEHKLNGRLLGKQWAFLESEVLRFNEYRKKKLGY